jgi:hypothetical protein
MTFGMTYIFSRFMKGYNFYNIKITREAAAADTVVALHHIGLGCQFPNHQETCCFKWEFYV